MLRITMLGALAAGLASLATAAPAQELNRELAEVVALEEQQLAEARALYPQYFAEAYARYPEIPRGILEAIAWSKSRWRHLLPPEKQEPHHHMPSAYGVMGLYGGGGFADQVGEAARLLLVDRTAIIADPRMNILAAAALLADEIYWQAAEIKTPEDMAPVLAHFAGFPSGEEKSAVDDFARDSFAFDVLLSLERGVENKGVAVPKFPVAWKRAFDTQTLARLRAPFVRLDVTRDRVEASGYAKDPITGTVQQSAESGELAVQSADYGPAIWNPAHPSNYTARRNSAVSGVAIHTTEGNYAGAISWFKDPSADVSAHYVIRSSDGQVTQMVREAHRAWHVLGGHNDYTIGIEHEGWVDNGAWYTSAMYSASAALVRNLCGKYSVSCSAAYDGPPHSSVVVLPTSIRIKGHQHYSGNDHEDPGIHWNWPHYYSLLNGGNGDSDGGGGGGNPYTPTGACGSGFSVLDSHGLSGGTVYLLWNGESGENCVVTMKASNIGSPSSVSASLQVEGDSQAIDSGNFSYYAGPVKKSASNQCIKWGGSVGSSVWESPFEHCGS